MKLFDEIKPVFFIDNKMNDILNDINVKLKKINVNDKQKRKYMISKSKIRSIHSSLAIEANSLSLFDVESISENKLILGKKDEVQEVKNAIEAYNHINRLMSFARQILLPYSLRMFLIEFRRAPANVGALLLFFIILKN